MGHPLEQQEELEDTITGEPAKVILFNDDIHSFDEVISQVVKATRCSIARAEEIAYEAHNNGKAVAFSGEMVRCIEVSSILEEIMLMTQIEV